MSAFDIAYPHLAVDPEAEQVYRDELEAEAAYWEQLEADAVDVPDAPIDEWVLKVEAEQYAELQAEMAEVSER